MIEIDVTGRDWGVAGIDVTEGRDLRDSTERVRRDREASPGDVTGT